MKRLIVECRDYKGELISINPDTVTTYPDGNQEIKTYKVTLENVCGDTITARNVYSDDIILSIEG